MKQQGGIVTCFRGVQHCQDDGSWGECTDGEITQEPDLAAKEYQGFLQHLSSKKTQALSSVSPVECSETCDPNCKIFIEATPVPGEGEGSESSGSGQSCSHDMCTVDSSPLDATCCLPPNDGPNCCITKICAKDAYCCQSGWDGDCIDLMYTECLNRPPPFGLCDFGIYAEQAVLTKNRPAAGGSGAAQAAVGASIGSKGKITIGTDGSPGMIVTPNNLEIMSPNGKNINTGGGVWVGGNVTAQNGGGAQYNGNWNIGGTINLNGGSTINGKVLARGSVSNVTINGEARTGANAWGSGVGGTGTRVTSSNHPAPVIELQTVLPALPSNCPGGTSYSPGSHPSPNFQTLTPGNYGTVTMSNQAKLTLNGPGVYTFTSLNAQNLNTGGIQIGTNATAGVYTIIICGAFNLGNNVRIINHTGLANSYNNNDNPVLTDPGRLVIYAGSTVNFGTDGKFVGVLIAPNGKVTVADRTTVKGAIWAKNFESGTDMDAAGIGTAACEALGIPGSTPEINMCPIVTKVVPPITVDEYEYQAECPESTTARWKNLTWEATVPNDSSIAFSVKVGRNLAELESLPYVSLNTAQLDPPADVASCQLGGPAPHCPVPLTNKLALGLHQGQLLSLRLEANSGGGIPTISNWKLSYTCQFDE